MKDFISNIAQKLGYTIVKSSTYNDKKNVQVKVIENKEDLLVTFYNNLKRANFFPKFVVDIGANTGTWTKELIRHFPDANVLMIEPQERLKTHFEPLLNDKITYLSVGVGNKNDIFKFTIHDRDDSCSFVFTEEEAKSLGYEQIEIPIRTLNSIIKENNYPIPDIIKIDAEGLDLEVIEGASDFYNKTEVFLVEASVTNDTYKNTVSEVVKLMDKVGYMMYEITDLNRPFSETPILWLIEIAFVKKDGYLINNINLKV
ncbi:FkbM family methyltransferase [Empedobacter falsenii]|uniref:FkbM family methyltransferase n=1 Tax=Empedobacter falsenii TaxID=343874 RepID=A0AAW7DIX2_9FLAO|nr:FkbM family methyltransferase [Empedobacter falsenii]MDM1551974.1 FkbM family methyltransferase [Empedobacter falsenii]